MYTFPHYYQYKLLIAHKIRHHIRLLLHTSPLILRSRPSPHAGSRMINVMPPMPIRTRMGLLRATIIPDLWLSLKDADRLCLSVKHASGPMILFERHLWLNCDWVEGRCMLYALVDGNSGVNDCWLDDFAFDYGLYLLIDVMVCMFAGYS